jgi:hypothetical protein
VTDYVLSLSGKAGNAARRTCQDLRGTVRRLPRRQRQGQPGVRRPEPLTDLALWRQPEAIVPHDHYARNGSMPAWSGRLGRGDHEDA